MSRRTICRSVSMRRRMYCSTHLSRPSMNNMAKNHSFQCATAVHSAMVAVTAFDSGRTIRVAIVG